MCVYIYIFTQKKPWHKLHDLKIIAVIIINYSSSRMRNKSCIENDNTQ